jgi:hypothetical protein
MGSTRGRKPKHTPAELENLGLKVRNFRPEVSHRTWWADLEIAVVGAENI